jgi:hypothetical protein
MTKEKWRPSWGEESAETAYEFSSIGLVMEYEQLLLEPTDGSSPDKRNRRDYLEGVIISRLEGLKKPFSSGDKVQMKAECEEWLEVPDVPPIKRGEIKTVGLVFYDFIRETWKLEFDGDKLADMGGVFRRYPAEKFELAESSFLDKEDKMDEEENERLGRYCLEHQDEFVTVGSAHREPRKSQKSQPVTKDDSVGNIFVVFGGLIVLFGTLALFFMLMVVSRFL